VATLFWNSSAENDCRIWPTSPVPVWPGTHATRFGQIFRDTRNRMLSGYLLADLVDQVNKISFVATDDIHTMAHLHESMLREMRDIARQPDVQRGARQSPE
jgi:hypothetical protein